MSLQIQRFMNKLDKNLRRRCYQECHEQEISYHSFILYAFTIQKEDGNFISHDFRGNHKFKKYN